MRARMDDSRPIWQTIGLFLIPLMLSNILQSLSATANSIYIGRVIGVSALAAISAFFPLLFFMISFFIGIASGSTVLIGQAYGAGNTRRLKQVAGTTLGLTIVVGVVAGAAGAIFVHPLLSAIGTPPDIIATSESYARIIFLSLPLLFVYLVYITFLRGVGDAQTPFYFLLLSSLINIVATPAFLFGWLGLPHLGVNSAAVATIVANGGAFAAFMIFLRATNNPLQFDAETARDLLLDWPTVKTIVRIGIPTGVQLVMVSLSEIAVISFVNRFGSHATAAYGAVNQIVSYVQFPAISIGIASSIFGAQAIGGRRLDRLGPIARSAVGLNYAIGGVLIAICYAFSWPLLGLFLTDMPTLLIARQLLMITLWSYLIFGNNAVLSGIMRSSGTVLWPTLLAVVSIWGVEVPAAYLLMKHFGLDGIWIAYPIAFVANLCFQSTYYFAFWKKRQIKALV
jgi:putative MATE family efflux protein